MIVNVTAPMETASGREQFAFYRRVAAKLQRVEERDVTTTDATETEIWAGTVPPNGLLHIQSRVAGLSTAAASGAAYVRVATFRRVGTAVATQVATTSVQISHEDVGAWSSTIEVSPTTTGDVRVTVTGAASTTIYWQAAVTILTIAL